MYYALLKKVKRMKKILKNNINELYIIENESSDGILTIRTFLSDKTFDVNKKDIPFCIVNKNDFYDDIERIISIVNYICFTGERFVVDENSGIILIAKNDDATFCRTLLSETLNGLYIKVDSSLKLREVNKDYVMSRIAKEYSYISENDNDIYSLNGNGMYYKIKEVGDLCFICKFRHFDDCVESNNHIIKKPFSSLKIYN